LTKNAKTPFKLQKIDVCTQFLHDCIFAKKCKMQNARSCFCTLQAGKLIILQKVARCKMQNRLFANCAPWEGIEILLHNRNCPIEIVFEKCKMQDFYFANCKRSQLDLQKNAKCKMQK
jgi:hypothetical protein